MDAGSIFLILALVLVIALFITRPFFTPRREESPEHARQTDTSEHRRSTLLAERDRLLTALQELDFDNSLGKIPEEDYPATRASLKRNAALIYRRLDEMQAENAVESTDDRIERAIAARRADAAVTRGLAGGSTRLDGVKPNDKMTEGTAIALPEDELEEIIATRRRERQEKSAGFCPKCGKPAQKSDRFCSRCGTVL